MRRQSERIPTIRKQYVQTIYDGLRAQFDHTLAGQLEDQLEKAETYRSVYEASIEAQTAIIGCLRSCVEGRRGEEASSCLGIKQQLASLQKQQNEHRKSAIVLDLTQKMEHTANLISALNLALQDLRHDNHALTLQVQHTHHLQHTNEQLIADIVSLKDNYHTSTLQLQQTSTQLQQTRAQLQETRAQLLANRTQLLQSRTRAQRDRQQIQEVSRSRDELMGKYEQLVRRFKQNEDLNRKIKSQYRIRFEEEQAKIQRIIEDNNSKIAQFEARARDKEVHSNRSIVLDEDTDHNTNTNANTNANTNKQQPFYQTKLKEKIEQQLRCELSLAIRTQLQQEYSLRLQEQSTRISQSLQQMDEKLRQQQQEKEHLAVAIRTLEQQAHNDAQQMKQLTREKRMLQEQLGAMEQQLGAMEEQLGLLDQFTICEQRRMRRVTRKMSQRMSQRMDKSNMELEHKQQRPMGSGRAGQSQQQQQYQQQNSNNIYELMDGNNSVNKRLLSRYSDSLSYGDQLDKISETEEEQHCTNTMIADVGVEGEVEVGQGSSQMSMRKIQIVSDLNIMNTSDSNIANRSDGVGDRPAQEQSLGQIGDEGEGGAVRQLNEVCSKLLLQVRQCQSDNRCPSYSEQQSSSDDSIIEDDIQTIRQKLQMSMRLEALSPPTNAHIHAINTDINTGINTHQSQSHTSSSHSINSNHAHDNSISNYAHDNAYQIYTHSHSSSHQQQRHSLLPSPMTTRAVLCRQSLGIRTSQMLHRLDQSRNASQAYCRQLELEVAQLQSQLQTQSELLSQQRLLNAEQYEHINEQEERIESLINKMEDIEEQRVRAESLCESKHRGLIKQKQRLVEQLYAELEQIRDENKEFVGICEQSRKELEAERRKVDNLEDDIRELDSERLKLSQDKHRLEAETQHHAQQKHSYQIALADKQHALTQAETQLHSLTTTIDTLNHKLDNNQQLIRGLEASLLSQNKCLADLQSRIKAKTQQGANNRQEIQKLKKIINELGLEINRLRSQLGQKQSMIAGMEAKIEEMEHERRMLLKNNQDLKYMNDILKRDVMKVKEIESMDWMRRCQQKQNKANNSNNGDSSNNNNSITLKMNKKLRSKEIQMNDKMIDEQLSRASRIKLSNSFSGALRSDGLCTTSAIQLRNITDLGTKGSTLRVGDGGSSNLDMNSRLSQGSNKENLGLGWQMERQLDPRGAYGTNSKLNLDLRSSKPGSFLRTPLESVCFTDRLDVHQRSRDYTTGTRFMY